MVDSSSPIIGVSSDCGVVTESGLVDSGSVRVGDFVLTKSGNYERVTEVISTGRVVQSVCKVSIPLVRDPFSSTVYLSSNSLVYGLIQENATPHLLSADDLTSLSFVFLPGEVMRRSPMLGHKLRGENVITVEDGVFLPVGRVSMMERKMDLVSFVTESGSFVAGGLTVCLEDK